MTKKYILLTEVVCVISAVVSLSLYTLIYLRLSGRLRLDGSRISLNWQGKSSHVRPPPSFSPPLFRLSDSSSYRFIRTRIRRSLREDQRRWERLEEERRPVEVSSKFEHATRSSISISHTCLCFVPRSQSVKWRVSGSKSSPSARSVSLPSTFYPSSNTEATLPLPPSALLPSGLLCHHREWDAIYACRACTDES